MKEPDKLRSLLMIGVGAGVLYTVGVALWDAIALAYGSGMIQVPPTGKHKPWQHVAWYHAWPYLLALGMLGGAATLFVAQPFTRRFGLTATALGMVGLVVLLFSGLLSNPLSAAALLGVVIVLPSAFFYSLKKGSFLYLGAAAVVLLLLLVWAWHT